MKEGKGFLIFNGYLYAFNFAPTIESHEENLKDGDGFEIIAKIKINLTNEEQNEFKENFKRGASTINQVLGNNEFKSRRSGSSNQPVKNTKSNRGNAGLDKGKSREGTRKSGDSNDSLSDKGGGIQLTIPDIESEIEDNLC